MRPVNFFLPRAKKLVTLHFDYTLLLTQYSFMAESLTISRGTLRQRYENLLPQLRGLLSNEDNAMGMLANAAAALRQTFHFFWVGFYLTEEFVRKEPTDRLLLGPFQGDIACYVIRKGRGVCGTAWAEQRTVVVPDVEAFPGHIACSSLSRSEIVVPLFNESRQVIGVLDVDSDRLDAFTPDDKWGLEQCAAVVAQAIGK